MTNAKQQFAARLKKAMETAGYEAKPAVLEREFNQRYMGSSLTLHGVRKWLLGYVPGRRGEGRFLSRAKHGMRKYLRMNAIPSRLFWRYLRRSGKSCGK
jgi:hypothetical protein